MVGEGRAYRREGDIRGGRRTERWWEKGGVQEGGDILAYNKQDPAFRHVHLGGMAIPFDRCSPAFASHWPRSLSRTSRASVVRR